MTDVTRSCCGTSTYDDCRCPPAPNNPDGLSDARARVKRLLMERAAYFDSAKGYREWSDAARSYRATAADVDNIFAQIATPPASTSTAIAAGEVLEWLTDCDNLILSHCSDVDAWQVRRASGMIRGEGSTPLAALRAAMLAAAPKAASEDGATGEVIERLKSMISPSGRLAFTAAALDKLGARELETVKLAIAACEAARFLSDRLDELEWIEGDMAATCRDYFGHVDPAHARLRTALAERPAAPPVPISSNGKDQSDGHRTK